MKIQFTQPLGAKKQSSPGVDVAQDAGSYIFSHPHQNHVHWLPLHTCRFETWHLAPWASNWLGGAVQILFVRHPGELPRRIKVKIGIRKIPKAPGCSCKYLNCIACIAHPCLIGNCDQRNCVTKRVLSSPRTKRQTPVSSHRLGQSGQSTRLPCAVEGQAKATRTDRAMEICHSKGSPCPTGWRPPWHRLLVFSNLLWVAVSSG